MKWFNQESSNSSGVSGEVGEKPSVDISPSNDSIADDSAGESSGQSSKRSS